MKKTRVSGTTCPVCQRKFKTFQGLGGHMSGPCGDKLRLKHGKKSNMTRRQCKTCNKTFTSRQAFGGHMRGPCGKPKRRLKRAVERLKAMDKASEAVTTTTGSGTTSGTVAMVVRTSGQTFCEKHSKMTGLLPPTSTPVRLSPGTLKPGVETVLEEAQRIVHGERNKDYGHPLDDFTRTAEMATGLFRGKLLQGAKFTAEDVGLFQVLVKLSRQMNAPKRDNMVDTAGYAGTVQMCIEERERRSDF